MSDAGADVVTGAFGYTGRYIARRLLETGRRVVTLTGRAGRPNPFGERVAVRPFNFDRPAELAASLRGADTLYNTYWVRFPYGRVTFEQAVENTQTLIRAAEVAGVRRIVHVSVANASEQSPLPYFRGKALVDKAVISSRLSYAIIRPTVIFGGQDILINNIAWLLRRFPVFGVFGEGDYAVQPVFVEDVAELAVRAGRHERNVVIDAIGPETYSFEELVRLIAGAVGSKAKIVRLPAGPALWVGRLIGRAVGDVLITREEIEGLMSGLLACRGPATAPTRFSDWLARSATSVGRTYASELKRHYR